MEGTTSFTTKFINIFISPRDTFESLKETPDWLIPVIIIAVAAVIMLFFTWPYIMDLQVEKTMERLQNNPNMTAEQMAQIAERMRSPVQKYIGYAAALIFPAIIFLIQAAVFHFTSMFLGGKNTFKQVFSTVCYSSLVGLLWLVIYTPLVLLQGRADISASLNFLASDTDSVLYLILTKLDLFQLWSLYLTSMGLSVMAENKLGQSAGIVFGWWIVWCGISVGWQVLWMNIFS